MFAADLFTLSKATGVGCYVTEASDLGLRAVDRIPQRFQISGLPGEFFFTNTDKDSEGEITGWRYHNNHTGHNALIIND